MDIAPASCAARCSGALRGAQALFLVLVLARSDEEDEDDDEDEPPSELEEAVLEPASWLLLPPSPDRDALVLRDVLE